MGGSARELMARGSLTVSHLLGIDFERVPLHLVRAQNALCGGLHFHDQSQALGFSHCHSIPD